MKNLLVVIFSLATSLTLAQTATSTVLTASPAADAWNYKTARLNSTEIDALLAKPEQLLVIDVRRPDELIVKGSFPVYLNIQSKELEKHLAYIPKDRTIITVSNHAHRAGATGDLLTSKGFKVAGAAGSEDYEAQGGKAIVRIAAPLPKTAALLDPKK